MVGIMSRDEALELANERKLDLVNISPNANPPVCKILDYGKYRYELQKREKEAKKKQKTMQISLRSQQKQMNMMHYSHVLCLPLVVVL